MIEGQARDDLISEAVEASRNVIDERIQALVNSVYCEAWQKISHLEPTLPDIDATKKEWDENLEEDRKYHELETEIKNQVKNILIEKFGDLIKPYLEGDTIYL